MPSPTFSDLFAREDLSLEELLGDQKYEITDDSSSKYATTAHQTNINEHDKFPAEIFTVPTEVNTLDREQTTNISPAQSSEVPPSEFLQRPLLVTPPLKTQIASLQPFIQDTYNSKINHDPLVLFAHNRNLYNGMNTKPRKHELVHKENGRPSKKFCDRLSSADTDLCNSSEHGKLKPIIYIHVK